MGAKVFQNGHDTKLIDIAVEAVKGKTEVPAINVENTNSIEQQLEPKTIIIELNTDSFSMRHFEVENNANNRALGNRAGFRWLREVKGRNVK